MKPIDRLRCEHEKLIKELEERNKKDSELFRAAVDYLCGNHLFRIKAVKKEKSKNNNLTECKPSDLLNHEG